LYSKLLLLRRLTELSKSAHSSK